MGLKETWFNMRVMRTKLLLNATTKLSQLQAHEEFYNACADYSIIGGNKNSKNRQLSHEDSRSAWYIVLRWSDKIRVRFLIVRQGGRIPDLDSYIKFMLCASKS